MAEQAISCPSCGKKIPLTRALRAEIEGSVREQYEEALQKRERELQSAFAERMKADVASVADEAARAAEKKDQPGTVRAEGTAERPVTRTRGEADARTRDQEART